MARRRSDQANGKQAEECGQNCSGSNPSMIHS
jgi:hypothetical protein